MKPDIDPTWAWDVYRPSPQEPWDLRKVGHLYRRAAFSTTKAELDHGLRAGPDQLIDHLLTGGAGQEKFESQTRALVPSMVRVNNGVQARAWWLYRMLYAP